MRWGYTLVELMVVMGIVAVLGGIGGVTLWGSVGRAELADVTEAMWADCQGQQAKAVAGEASQGNQVDSWSVRVEADRYILFPGSSYVPGAGTNIEVMMPEGVTITTTLSDNQVSYAKGTGEVIGYQEGFDAITITQWGESQTIRVNRYGARD